MRVLLYRKSLLPYHAGAKTALFYFRYSSPFISIFSKAYCRASPISSLRDLLVVLERSLYFIFPAENGLFLLSWSLIYLLLV